MASPEVVAVLCPFPVRIQPAVEVPLLELSSLGESSALVQTSELRTEVDPTRGSAFVPTVVMTIAPEIPAPSVQVEGSEPPPLPSLTQEATAENLTTEETIVPEQAVEVLSLLTPAAIPSSSSETNIGLWASIEIGRAHV